MQQQFYIQSFIAQKYEIKTKTLAILHYQLRSQLSSRLTGAL
jgi:hypothetical protein